MVKIGVGRAALAVGPKMGQDAKAMPTNPRHETLEQKIARVLADPIAVVDHDPAWPGMFQAEKARLLDCLPPDLVIRIEHFGSTAIPGLAAKPVVDVLIEITDENRGKVVIPEILEPQGCDCFWRPLGNEDVPPYFTWCIRRDKLGARTHHLHFNTPGFKDAELRFRDILLARPDLAERYGELKKRLGREHAADRVAYTEAKGEFVREVLAAADGDSV